MSILINGLRGLPKYKSLKQDHILPCYISIHEDDTAELNIAGMAFPLSKVPTPHGRLIDADELETHVDNWWDIGEYVFADTIRNADTIIEAEVNGE